MTLLAVRDLSVGLPTPRGMIRAVDRLSFSVARSETLAIVGESGCGKSVTALALMRLLARTARVEGSVRFEEQEILALGEREMRGYRGRRLAIIFQDPTAALNPVTTIGEQIVETIRAHEPVAARAAWARGEELLDLVRIPEPRRRMTDYPHRLSGGMRQRVAIAIALAAKPALLIADEPTTALDVTIQAQILGLLHQLQRELDMALILITHDLGVVAEMADRVMVMYAGRKAEDQPVRDLFARPLHPYTKRLMAAKPRPGVESAGERRRLHEIQGLVPMLTERVPGCAFASRCLLADGRCRETEPALRAFGAHSFAACHKADLVLAGAA